MSYETDSLESEHVKKEFVRWYILLRCSACLGNYIKLTRNVVRESTKRLFCIPLVFQT